MGGERRIDAISVLSIIKGIIFSVAALLIVMVSWPALRRPRSHGFPRFFAFMAILGLLVLNVDHWFVAPFTPLHIVSWALLTASLLLVIHGFYLLRVVGQPRENIEDTTKLVRVGAYRYIRHPLYSSLLCLVWGICLKDPSLLSIGLALAATAALIATARTEEVENLQRFGDDYVAYMEKTKLFIPYLL
ncbi:MAG: isoprenylcysteine carboxylmethyltransferase family protein [Fidelibacterota bacterium]|nr:MAG: isoprenylcysteine carboxylmethyltransferase family protein [Candidatus Neomarinimicrobiota bacterium]